MQNLLASWQHSAWNIPRSPTGGLDFAQELINNEGTAMKNDVGRGSGKIGRQRIERDISTIKCYNCNYDGN